MSLLYEGKVFEEENDFILISISSHQHFVSASVPSASRPHQRLASSASRPHQRLVLISVSSYYLCHHHFVFCRFSSLHLLPRTDRGSTTHFPTILDDPFVLLRGSGFSFSAEYRSSCWLLAYNE
jgi:hypothetical protein